MAPALSTGTFLLLLHQLTAIMAVSILTPHQALHTLERRQGSCPASNPVSCAAVDSKLPANFCCGANTSCISLDSSSSALCCPNSGPCSAIQTINCNVGLQNAADLNAGPIFTTRLNDKLPTCADACCPFGYTCSQRTDGSSFCLIIASKAITAPVSSVASSASSITSTSTSTLFSSSTSTSSITSAVTATPTVQASGIDSTKPQSKDPSTSFPPGVFLAGLLPGMVVGALCVLAWFILTGRAKKSSTKGNGDLRSNPSIYRKRPEIADPYGDVNTRRLTFIQKTKGIGHSAKTLFGKKEDSGGTPGLPFDSADQGWKNLTPPKNNDIPADALGRQVPAGPNATTPTAMVVPRSLTYGLENRYEPRPTTKAAYPVTPDRNDRYTVTDDPTGEMIRIYTPPNVARPSAAIAPVRGMSTQRRSQDSGWGNYEPENEKSSSGGRPPYPTINDGRNVHEPSIYETLTPATYNGGRFQERSGRPERPETTFTDMLRAINFPDPINKGVPSMPVIPKRYR